MAYDIFTGEKMRRIFIPEIDAFLTVETTGNRGKSQHELVADCREIYHLSLV